MLRLITAMNGAIRSLVVGTHRFAADREGTTSVEYGLIVAGIVVAVIAAIFALGSDISDFLNGLGPQLPSKTPS